MWFEYREIVVVACERVIESCAMLKLEIGIRVRLCGSPRSNMQVQVPYGGIDWHPLAVGMMILS